MAGITVSFSAALYNPQVHSARCNHIGIGAHGFALQFSGSHNQSDLFFYPVGVEAEQNVSFTDAVGTVYSIRVSVTLFQYLTVLTVRSGGLTWAMSQ